MQMMGATPLEMRLLAAVRWIEGQGAPSTEATRSVAVITDAITALQAQRYANPGGSTAWGLDGQPNPVMRESELMAKALRHHTNIDHDGQPEGTLESLLTCVNMIETYTPESLPANEHGQVHFARAMLESAADEIKAYVSNRQSS